MAECAVSMAERDIGFNEVEADSDLLWACPLLPILRHWARMTSGSAFVTQSRLLSVI